MYRVVFLNRGKTVSLTDLDVNVVVPEDKKTFVLSRMHNKNSNNEEISVAYQILNIYPQAENIFVYIEAERNSNSGNNNAGQFLLLFAYFLAVLFAPIIIALGMYNHFLLKSFYKDSVNISAFRKFRKIYLRIGFAWLSFIITFTFFSLSTKLGSDGFTAGLVSWFIGDIVYFIVSIIITKNIYKKHKDEERLPKEENINKTITRIAESKNKGEITKEEYNQQLKIILNDYEVIRKNNIRSTFINVLSVIVPMILTFTIMGLTNFKVEEAHKEFIDSIKYRTESDGSLTITYYDFNGEDLKFPSDIEGKRVTRIEKEVCRSDSVKSTFIPSTINYIDPTAFSYCKNLKTITVDNNNSTYDSRENCNAVIETNSNTLVAGCYGSFVPDSVSSIGERAFFHCVNLTSIDLSDNITSIGESAFSYCPSLSSISLSNNITSINDNTFYKCTNLSTITLPNSLTSIGKESFYYCSSLSSINIPRNVNSIGERAFSVCSSLSSIVVSSYSKTYDSRENCNAIIEKESNSLIIGCKYTDIPSDVTSISDNAFYACSELTSIYIPYSVTSIGDNAFYSCLSLNYIFIAGHITSLGDNAFNKCSKLTSIDIPGTVTHFGENIFSGCFKLASVEIGYGITSIVDNLFKDCASLSSISIPSSVTSIGQNAFCGCKSLQSINIPDNVTEIGDNAFYNCSSLSFVDFPKKLTTIGHNLFNNCSSLTSISIPDSVTVISHSVFSGCSNLSSITLGKNVRTIYSSAFYNCSSLSSIIIPKSVTFIGDNAFYGCSSLTIYFEATSKEGIWFGDNWNVEDAPVVWGYVLE